MKNFIRFSIISSLLICMFLSLCAFDKDAQKVFDYADVLTSGEEEEITNAFKARNDAYGLDFVFVTTNDTQGKGEVQYSDDFYDEGGFGYDENHSGIMLLMDIDNRKVYINTVGSALAEINDVEIEVILDKIFEYMDDEKYKDACLAFLDASIEAYTSSKYDDVNYSDYENSRPQSDWLSPVFGDSNPDSAASYFRKPYVSLPIAAGIALIIVLIIAFARRPKMTAGSSTYMAKNSFSVKHQSDVFLGRHTVTRHIDSGSGGSHGGSSHMSSGGISHGGGGRSF